MTAAYNRTGALAPYSDGQVIDHETGEILPGPALGEFSPTGWAAPPGMTFEEWERTGHTLQQIQGAVNWWVGDWLNEGEKRYGETYAQAIEATGWKYEQLALCKWVASSVEFSIRIENLSWTHHREVAALPPNEQADLLQWAEANDASVADLKKEKRRRAHKALVEAPPLVGTYRVIYADPPWDYDNSGFDQSAAHHYPTMTVDEIAALPVGDLAAEPAVLYMWATVPLLPEAIRVMEAWGFEYKTHRVWVKDRAPGVGWWGKTYHELLLIGAANGNYHPAEKLSSVVEAPVGRHSRKPDVFRQDIERVHDGPYIELFAREAASGWESWGNEDV